MLNRGQLENIAVVDGAVEQPSVKTLSTLDYDLAVPYSHEERLEWVRKSCERFFVKVREFETMVNLFEPNQA